MKLSLAAILGLLLLVLMFTLTQCSRNTQESKPISANQLLTQLPSLIEQSSQLVVLTVTVDTHAQAKREGLLGASRTTGSIRGVLRIGSELGLLQIKTIDEEQHQLEVRLPQPSILHVSIDHQASTVTSQREGLWHLALGSACRGRKLIGICRARSPIGCQAGAQGLVDRSQARHVCTHTLASRKRSPAKT